MKRLVFIGCVLTALVVWAERPLGAIVSKGDSNSNKGITGDAGFKVPPMAKITVQAINPDGGSAAAWVCVDNFTCAVGQGVYITGTQAVPLGTGGAQPLIDAGTSAAVSCISAEYNICYVSERNGRE